MSVFGHYWSAKQANSAFHPSWVGKWVVIYAFTTAKLETIKRQIKTIYRCKAAGQSVRDCGLGLWPRLYAYAVIVALINEPYVDGSITLL